MRVPGTVRIGSPAFRTEVTLCLTLILVDRDRGRNRWVMWGAAVSCGRPASAAGCVDMVVREGERPSVTGWDRATTSSSDATILKDGTAKGASGAIATPPHSYAQRRNTR